LTNASSSSFSLSGQWDTISAGRPSPRTELLHNIDPMGLDLDLVTGTKQAALRQGPWKILVGNPSQNVAQNGWVPPPCLEKDTKAPPSPPLAPPCAPCTFTRKNLTTGVCLFNVEEDPEEVRATVWLIESCIDRSY